jgi:hypothetical protein
MMDGQFEMEKRGLLGLEENQITYSEQGGV